MLFSSAHKIELFKPWGIKACEEHLIYKEQIYAAIFERFYIFCIIWLVMENKRAFKRREKRG
ncbi:hypothetical protein CQA63_07350 [Helicobacter marmotae]|uniref:Uncharacterized protein n=1 Tax=Helicobacter marmotae TaxID=152490 RepID=A0A3D8I285_9HELI|nr:hypothetical protein CQA63_07350 [Helicobacter marmotae]